ncbi:class D sortase [Paenibacillus roseipurpureus]|uniref:Class D sortase n=1 Tax=Paenibacillus roseopurpureus TaxID=2918901 RepID=A0AA96RMX4_9BACL|nr:class D sortase [Paenibacillus sp. MBLB1832]WNR44782.1 class D sortase [Paenibacillus sp. MBLB1832]
MLRRVVAPFLVLTGIFLFLYPTLNDRYETYQQHKILKMWQVSMDAMEGNEDGDGTEVVEGAGAADGGVASSFETSGMAATATPVIAPRPDAQLSSSPLPVVKTAATPKPAPVKLKNMEGILNIEKIDLKLPILTDATLEHMKISIASIVGTGKAGEIGNYAIAGHRNLTYGKNFNRLDEVELGDRIEVDTGKALFVYKVVEKQDVLPTDVWVLRGNNTDREITLITCDPMVDPTHRLIVKGKLVE